MEYLNARRNCVLVLLLCLFASTAFAANIGTLVPVVGTVADLIYDAPRNVVYLANSSRNQVEIYSVDGGQLTGSILTGLQPASLALSPDGNTLYAANVGSLTVSVINLVSRQRVSDYSIGSRPDAIAVGSDGKIVILGTAGLLRLDPVTGLVSPVPISPPATPPVGVNIGASPTPAGFLAGLVTTASGNLIIGLSTNRLFVYEVASGTVLRSRNVTGLRAILSASTDGSRFMAGPFLFDTQTLTILGRAGTVAATLTGGSAFSVDGNAVYATFSTQPAINPLNTNNPQNPGGAVVPGAIAGQNPSAQVTRAVLQIMRSSSLTPQLGLRLAEAITSKIISSADGQYLFANSATGLQVIPIGQLNNLPVLDVSTTNVVLSVDICNRLIATATVQVRNVGGGRMTFAAVVNSTNLNAPVILDRGSGVAPATLTISFDPRSVTTRGTLQYAVMLLSPEAVNIEPAILANLNFRDVSDRGAIVPMTGVGVDLQMDAARQRLYIANYTQDQIEVFSLATQTFLPPIRVGNRPFSMAMVDADTLVVANNGAEGVSVVDLEAMQEVEQISMGPIPLNAAPLFPLSIAASSNAVLFSAAPLAAAGLARGNGQIWQLSRITHSAVPRRNLGLGALNVIQGRNMLIAPADGSAIVTVEGNGTLRMYDPIADTFTVTRVGAVPGLRGTVSAASDGSFYVVDNLVFNSVLGAHGAIAPSAVGLPAQTANATLAFGVTATGNTAIRVQAGTPQSPLQSLWRYNLLTLQSDLQVSLPEQVLDISPALVGTANGTRQWPPRATALELGVNNQTQLLRRGIAVNNNTAYVLTFSGLSVVSLTSPVGRSPLLSGVVNGASRTGALSPGSLITINGVNLADAATVAATPWPRTLAGVCVTANEIAIPLFSTSPTQIQAQLPPDLGTGRFTLTVRSTRLGLSSAGSAIQVAAVGPGVFALDVSGQQRAALVHSEDGALVIPDYPARRDETLLLYATGLGPVTPAVGAGQAGSSSPPSAVIQPVGVSIGGVPYLVTWAGLAPDNVGIYQINIYVPGSRAQGDDLPVVVTVGGTSSTVTNAPLASIH
ncbi:MAG: hypothetical protein EXQ52_00035 [Bryobacterales bacterium]|nr:hypothetical protein [Bryobacterales bacterium]